MRKKEVLLFRALRFVVLFFCRAIAVILRIIRGNLAICPILKNK